MIHNRMFAMWAWEQIASDNNWILNQILYSSQTLKPLAKWCTMRLVTLREMDLINLRGEKSILKVDWTIVGLERGHELGSIY